MLYAKVVLGLPLEGPFDYSVPPHLSKTIKIGARVRVSFGSRQRLIGYVVGLTHKSDIVNIKDISEIIDTSAVLSEDMLRLTKELSEYYCCSWGEVIETALPDELRRGKKLPDSGVASFNPGSKESEIVLLYDLNGNARWGIYLENIKQTLDNGRQAVILFPDIDGVLRFKEIVSRKLGIEPVILFRKQSKSWVEWLKIKEGKTSVVIGTRSAVFAPLNNLGLIIIDEEQNSVYKQDQVPHYHAREAAFMRAKLAKVKLILGSISPSIEMFNLAQRNKVKYCLLPRENPLPQIKIIPPDYIGYRRRKKNLLSRFTQDSIALTLKAQGKVLLFLNRKGYSTFASCHNCGFLLTCQRCNSNLVYYLKENILSCHHCNFKISPPKICPNCNSSYISYSGTGAEKIENELCRLFPNVRIKAWNSTEKINDTDADVFVATSAIIGKPDFNFSLTVMLGIDNYLNRIDLRAAEKSFALLSGVLLLTANKMIIQSRLNEHHCIKAFLNQDVNVFYTRELRERKELGFPPYSHLAMVKLRGKREERVKEISNALFKRLSDATQDKSLKTVAVMPGGPSKLRGYFCWQILMRCNNTKKLSGFLKRNLKSQPHSGIIVTVDVDPV